VRLPRPPSFAAEVFGYVILALGIFGTINYCVSMYLYSLPQNMGIELGNGSIVLLGLATIAIARCLKALERRLDVLEGRQQAEVKSQNAAKTLR
jgi:hypothetical protein